MTPETNTSPFDSAIAELENRIRNMQMTLETLKVLKALPETSASVAGNLFRAPGNEVRHDTFFEMTIADAARKYLNMMKATKSNADIADALERGGLKHSSKDFATTVRSVLGQRDDFRRVPNGDWGLSEWYGGLGRGRKAKPETQSKTKHAPKRAKEPKRSTLFADEEPQHKPAMEGTAEDKIMAAIRANPNEEWTQSKIAEATGLKPTTTAGTVFRLRKEQKIRNREDGKGYVIA